MLVCLKELNFEGEKAVYHAVQSVQIEFVSTGSTTIEVGYGLTHKFHIFGHNIYRLYFIAGLSTLSQALGPSFEMVASFLGLIPRPVCS